MNNIFTDAKETERGFEIIHFNDRYGKKCSLQQSSLVIYDQPGSSAIWLGCDDNRMHLSFDMVIELRRFLSNWIETGSFKEED